MNYLEGSAAGGAILAPGRRFGTRGVSLGSAVGTHCAEHGNFQDGLLIKCWTENAGAATWQSVVGANRHLLDSSNRIIFWTDDPRLLVLDYAIHCQASWKLTGFSPFSVTVLHLHLPVGW